MTFSSVLDRVLEHAASAPDKDCVRLVSRRRGRQKKTYREVAEDARRAAAFLARAGVRRGDIVAIVGTHDLSLYGAWLGVVWLGAIPAVLAVPTVRVDKEVYWSRLRALFQLSEIRTVLIEPAYMRQVTLPEGVRVFDSSVVIAEDLVGPEPHRPEPDAPILLQHSSGTTGLQKGVMLTHGMVMACAASAIPRRGYRFDDIGASWLPLYHDMGLIGSFVFPMLVGMTMVWLSPFEWVTAPESLLEAITENRATHTWLPNFAFLFLAERVSQPAESFDLRSLRAVNSGGEPASFEALSAFANRYAPAGVRWDTLFVAYGMAEAVLTVTASGPGLPPKILHVDRAIWRREHRAELVDPAVTEDYLLHVSCGTAIPSCEVEVVDEESKLCAPRQAGRILVRSAHVFRGYYRRPELDRDLFDARGFFRTGDTGYFDEDGHLYVTGRTKDLIIVAGRNIYPTDVEDAVSRVEGLAAGRVVCFGVTNRTLGTENVVVLAESDEPEARWPELELSMRAAAVKYADVELSDARIVTRRSLRKSTSGKLARVANYEGYVEGRFGAVSILGLDVPPSSGG